VHLIDCGRRVPQGLLREPLSWAFAGSYIAGITEMPWDAVERPFPPLTALVTCPSCGEMTPVSEHACRHCGEPLPRRTVAHLFDTSGVDASARIHGSPPAAAPLASTPAGSDRTFGHHGLGKPAEGSCDVQLGTAPPIHDEAPGGIRGLVHNVSSLEATTMHIVPGGREAVAVRPHQAMSCAAPGGVHIRCSCGEWTADRPNSDLAAAAHRDHVRLVTHPSLFDGATL
jgi:hypothetical protein